MGSGAPRPSARRSAARLALGFVLWTAGVGFSEGSAAAPEGPGDPLRQAPRDLLLGFREEGRPEGVFAVSASGVLAGLTTSADDDVRGRVLVHRRLGAGWTRLGTWAGNDLVLLPASAAVYLAGKAAGNGRVREGGLMALEALALSGLETEALKWTVRRPRPDGSDRQSFPSGHASAAFSLAAVAGSEWGWKAGVPAALAAGYVGYCRLEADKHRLSDVLFGAGLGIAAGRAVWKVHRGAKSGRVVFAPWIAPEAVGLGVNF